MRWRRTPFAIAAAALAAVLAAGCVDMLDRGATLTVSGLGSGSSPGQSLPAGRYSVAWAIDDSDDPDAVCTFELALASASGVLHQLAHTTVTTGGTSGQSDFTLDEPTVVTVAARTTTCGQWMVSFRSLPTREDVTP